jgi:hypothetical protein
MPAAAAAATAAAGAGLSAVQRSVQLPVGESVCVLGVPGGGGLGSRGGVGWVVVVVGGEGGGGGRGGLPASGCRACVQSLTQGLLPALVLLFGLFDETAWEPSHRDAGVLVCHSRPQAAVYAARKPSLPSSPAAPHPAPQAAHCGHIRNHSFGVSHLTTSSCHQSTRVACSAAASTIDSTSPSAGCCRAGSCLRAGDDSYKSSAGV